VGAIGSMVVRHALERSYWVELVGAVDSDPAKVGRDVGDVVGLRKEVGLTVSATLDEALEGREADLVVHTTSSFLEKVTPELERAAEHGLDVVSSCEQLSFPYYTNPTLAERLDLLAKREGVTILGTGINPGFAMDVLPAVLTAPCLNVRAINVTRKMDASNRRVPFRRKLGVGMNVEEFREAVRNGKITGHVGLGESVSLLASALSWKLEEVRVGEAQPVISLGKARDLRTAVEAGRVAGVKQTAVGVVEGRQAISHTFLAYVGAREEYDLVEVDGLPKVISKISPCVHGDFGTVAMLLNMAPKVLASPPGLLTMKDMVLPSAFLPSL